MHVDIPTNYFNIDICSIANWSGKLSEEIVAKYITLGLETWGRYANLQFKRVNSPEADIIVAFGRGYHGDS